MALSLAGCLLACLGATGFIMNAGGPRGEFPRSRRDALANFARATGGAAAAGVLVARPTGAHAAVKVNKALGQESFRRIRDARKQLDEVDVPLRARKFEEVQALLDSGPTADLESSLVNLVKSNSLPADDKVTVGTIRRYGLAADALISLGGLSAASRDRDGGEARRQLTLTKESLNDILAIGVNNNLNKAD